MKRRAARETLPQSKKTKNQTYKRLTLRFPRQRQTHAQTSFSLWVFRLGFQDFFLCVCVCCLLSYFRMRRNPLKYRKNIRFCLFRSDQCKLYKEIQRHAIVMYRVYVYWQRIDVGIVSCKSAGSNMLHMTWKYSIVWSEYLELLKFPWKKVQHSDIHRIWGMCL